MYKQYKQNLQIEFEMKFQIALISNVYNTINIIIIIIIQLNIIINFLLLCINNQILYKSNKCNVISVT